MIITHKIKLDLARRGCDPIIHMTQSDTNSHQIHIRITKDRMPWTPPEGLSALVHYSNSFGFGGSYDTLADGRPAAAAVSDGITVTLVPEITALPGSVHVAVTLLYGGSTLSAFHIQLMVDALAASAAPVLANYSSITGFLPAPDVAGKGQYLTVGSVDEDGHITSVAPADPPEISGGTDSSVQLEETADGVLIRVVNSSGTQSSAQVLHGRNGIDGKDGADGKNGIDGKNGADGKNGVDGEDGITPHIGTNGNWFVGETDTGVQASGKDGIDGTDGKDGRNGTDGYTPVKGVDYMTYEDQAQMLQSFITQETGESTSLVMSQKAVTELVGNALGTGNGTAEYETVDSVEEMTDTSKTYVLSTTNTLWAYGETEVGTVREQVFDPENMFAGHMSGTSISTGASQKIYRVPLDISAFPADADIYVDVVGLFANDSNKTPALMKVGYSTLSNPATGSNQITQSVYAQATTIGSNCISNTENGCRFLAGYLYNEKIPEYSALKTMLLEIEDAHTASNISVYLEYDGGTRTAWYDTGVTPVLSGGGNTMALLIKVDKNTADIRNTDHRVTALEEHVGSAAVPAFWESSVSSAITKIKALQTGKNCVTFPFFSDNHQRNGYSGALIAKVMKACHLPYCFYGGDAIDSDYIASESVFLEQAEKFETMMSVIPDGRYCRAVGNHDAFRAASENEKHYYSRERIYELYLREGAAAQNKHFGDDGTYYYVDDIASKVRFVVLNTNGIRNAGNGIDGSTFDSTQLAWLRDTALHFDTAGWAVVFISHHPISNHYHANISNASEVRTIVNQSGAEVIGWFSGHIHRDRIYTGAATNTTDDSQGEEMGFTQVAITSDHTALAYDDATTHTVAEDAQSHAIDFITVNRNTRTVYLTRLGIGSDRSYTY